MSDPRRADRGFTIIEGMVACMVMLVGLLGLASLQVVGVQSNHFARHLAQASSLGQDLAEQMQRWDYNDPRLSPSTLRSWTIFDATSTAAMDREWEMGRGDVAVHTDGTPYVADFSDLPGDANAAVAGALATPYTGFSTDVDGDGVADYVRYWNVWATSFDGTTVTGKTVQIIVRWKQPGVGWREATMTTFRPVPNMQEPGL